MKCSVVKITLNPDDALRAGKARLANSDDYGVTTEEQSENFQGSTFEENQVDCIELHLVYRDGLACVNFINEEGVRVNYDYPIHSLKRISHKANGVTVH